MVEFLKMVLFVKFYSFYCILITETLFLDPFDVLNLPDYLLSCRLNVILLLKSGFSYNFPILVTGVIGTSVGILLAKEFDFFNV